MAKLKYSAPLLKFCPVLLDNNAGNGCAISSTQAEYHCAVVYDEDLGESLFMDESNGCLRVPASTIEANEYICYHVPMANANIYNS